MKVPVALYGAVVELLEEVIRVCCDKVGDLELSASRAGVEDALPHAILGPTVCYNARCGHVRT